MSIVQLAKVTLIGLSEAKTKVIEDLQDLGCLHLIPLSAEGDPIEGGGGPSRESREALEFLASCPNRRRQVTHTEDFDVLAVEAEALALKKRLFDLQEERDSLAELLEGLAPWGDFVLPPPEEMGGLRLWLYAVPRREIGDLERAAESAGLIWEIVANDDRFQYVVVIAREEPDIPFPRTETDERPPEGLRRRLEEVELALEDAQAARASLTRWCTLFARSLDGLEDRAARDYAARQTYDREPLYALQAWVPAPRIPELEDYAGRHGLALEVAEPDPSDTPPTLLENPPELRAGEDLVTFYRAPGYRVWDPSSVVFFSFALFFAMIIADAGYGLVVGAITAWLWKRLGQTESGRAWRILLATLSGASLVYGVLVGGYFGVTPPPDSLLGRAHLIDIQDSGVMMALSILIGAGHLILANLMDAYRQRGSLAALAPVGWALLVVGGLLLGGQLLVEDLPAWPGEALMAVGFPLILVFSGYGERPLARAAQGALALTQLTKAFGDVLSYLRLFALGLASASLAAAFNDMAADVSGTSRIAGIGIFLALLVLVLGHTLTFVLGIASAVIHGLRLNFIEFFDWSLKDEGYLFRAFQRKRGS